MDEIGKMDKIDKMNKVKDLIINLITH